MADMMLLRWKFEVKSGVLHCGIGYYFCIFSKSSKNHREKLDIVNIICIFRYYDSVV